MSYTIDDLGCKLYMFSDKSHPRLRFENIVTPANILQDIVLHDNKYDKHF